MYPCSMEHIKVISPQCGDYIFSFCQIMFSMCTPMLYCSVVVIILQEEGRVLSVKQNIAKKIVNLSIQKGTIEDMAGIVIEVELMLPGIHMLLH